MLGRPLAVGSMMVCLLVACAGSESAPADDDDDDDDGFHEGTGGSSSGASDGGSGNATSGTGAVGPSGSSGTGTSTGGMTGCEAGLGDACSDCAAQACSARYCTCYDNPACGSLIACTQSCAVGDANCAQSCMSQNPSGIADALLLNDCAAKSCAQGCPGATALGACEACAIEQCPAQMNTCLSNPECTQLIACVSNCNGDDFCMAGCAFDYGGGQNDAEAVQACVQGPCPACG